MFSKLRTGNFLIGALVVTFIGGRIGFKEVEKSLSETFVVPHRATWAVKENEPRENPGKYGLLFTDFEVRTASGITLNGWNIPTLARKSSGTVILLHGWGGSKEHMISMARLISVHGYNVIAYDSRAHGESTGDFCTYGFREKHDLSEIVTHAHDRYGEEQPIGVLGVSFGGAVALQGLPQEKRVQCGIVISSFCRLEDVARVQFDSQSPVASNWLLQRALAKGELRAEFKVQNVQPIEAAKEVGQPVLVIHGENDPLVPLADAQQLFHNLPSGHKRWYTAKNTDHDHILQYGDVVNVNREIIGFLQRNMPIVSGAFSDPPKEHIRTYHPMD